MPTGSLASAPCTWGVWERTIQRDDLVAPRRMLQPVRELDYTGIKLGPPGYFGRDAAPVLAPSTTRLALVGAFAPCESLSDGVPEDLGFLDSTLEILAATGAAGRRAGRRRERRPPPRRGPSRPRERDLSPR